MVRGNMVRRVILSGVLLVVFTCMPLFAALTWGPSGLTNPGADTPFAKVETDPTNTNIVWALTAHIPIPHPDYYFYAANGIYKSTDAGVTWTQMNDTLLTPDIPVYDIAIDPSNSDVAYIGTNTLGVLKTTDGGLSWLPVNEGITFQGLSFPEPAWGVLAVELDPENPQVVYAGVAQTYAVQLEQGSGEHPGLFKTYDGGATWVEKNEGLPARSDPLSLFDLLSHTASVWSILVLEQNPNIVVLGMVDMEVNARITGDRTARSNSRMFYSLNGGETGWTESSSGFPVIEEAREFPFTFAKMSVSMTSIAKNSGANFTVYASHIGVTAIAIVYPYLYTENLVQSRGVFKKVKLAPWQPINTGLPIANDDFNLNSINASPVVVSPVNPNIMLVGIMDADSGDTLSDASNVYLSNNGGASWSGTWATGLSQSPNGYYEASPFSVDINANQTRAYASVRWDFSAEFFYVNGTMDDGIYRMPPLAW
jgi:hypothetical protein